MGGPDTSTKTTFRKWNGTEWKSLTPLPSYFDSGRAIVFNDEIHIFGGSTTSTSKKKHYKWNGSEWVSVSTLPYEFGSGIVVVYENEIHIMGSSTANQGDQHYKWNGSEWVSVSTLPYDCWGGYGVVYNGELHIIGGNGGKQNHYKWNGSEWVSVSTLPYMFSGGSGLLYNGEIHIIGSANSQTSHSKWNGSEWVSVSTLPFNFGFGTAVIYNGEMCIAGSAYATDNTTLYSYKVNTVAPLTFVGKFLLKDKRSLTSMREYLNGDFVSLLPADLQTALTTVKKVTNGEVTNDKVWQLSVEEVADGNEIYPAIFKDASSRMKTTMDGTPSKWGLRSGEIVDENGAIITANDQTEDYGVLIGFCIG